MKKLSIIVALFAVVMLAACGGIQREPRDAYMPDMGQSRAIETYDDGQELREAGINYTKMPVPGTVARGQEGMYHIPKDRSGDSTNYVASKAVTNPVTFLTGKEMGEAERLYLIQCGICHGTNLDGNGPLYNGGKGKFSAAPANFTLDKYVSMPEGQMMYSTTYGKNAMGPYGAQLNTKQRWMIIRYIKDKQTKGKAGAATATTPAGGTGAAGTDTTGAAQTGN